MRWLVSVLLIAFPLLASAQGYPSKPVRMIIGFPAGGPADIFGRSLAQGMSSELGQPVVVENIGGVGGVLGVDRGLKAAPDGYTLTFNSASPLVIAPFSFAHLPYDIKKDVALITLAVRVPEVLAVHPSVPAKNLAELIAYAKANPGQLHYASGGNGSAQHVPMEMFKQIAGIDLVHVPYKGLGPAFNDVLAGQIPIMFAGLSNTPPHIRAGRIRALAIGSAKRSAAMPDVPTMQEAGVPGFDYSAWAGLLAPAGTPPAIVQKVNADWAKVVAMPEVRDKLVALGFELTPTSPAEFGEMIRREMAKVAKVVKDANIRVD
jgi:tripartite-type tricarboxylate transporter receptor subunit TctC